MGTANYLSKGFVSPWIPSRHFLRSPGSSAALALLSVGLLTYLFWATRSFLDVWVIPVIYLLLVLLIAAGLGRGASILASVLAALALDYYFLPPIYSIFTGEHAVLLGAFVVTGAIAGQLAEWTRRRTEEAETNRAEISRLYADLQDRAAEFQKQARLIDLAHDAILTEDLDARIQFWNQGAAEMYGFQKQEAVGKITDELLQTVIPMPRPKIMEILRQTGFWEGELTHTRQTGDQIVVATRWVLTNDAAGQPQNILEINNDITARKRAEEELVKANAELEARVLERTQDLFESKEMLEQEVAERQRAEIALAHRSHALARSNAELEQFAYIASHDLQEPLRMVRSYVQLLDRKYGQAFDSKGKEYMQYAVDGATRMQALIDDLLAYSRVDSQGGEFVPTDVTEVVRMAAQNLRSAIEECGARIFYDSLPIVSVDSNQLLQVFQNLISNAIKFCQVTPEIRITAERADEGWRFAVKDNGIGIDPQYFERIFLIFQRLHSRRTYPGTGIGLAVCKRIIERHRGRIWLESGLGRGTTFFFTLPDRQGSAK